MLLFLFLIYFLSPNSFLLKTVPSFSRSWLIFVNSFELRRIFPVQTALNRILLIHNRKKMSIWNLHRGPQDSILISHFKLCFLGYPNSNCLGFQIVSEWVSDPHMFTADLCFLVHAAGHKVLFITECQMTQASHIMASESLLLG